MGAELLLYRRKKTFSSFVCSQVRLQNSSICVYLELKRKLLVASTQFLSAADLQQHADPPDTFCVVLCCSVLRSSRQESVSHPVSSALAP